MSVYSHPRPIPWTGGDGFPTDTAHAPGISELPGTPELTGAPELPGARELPGTPELLWQRSSSLNELPRYPLEGHDRVLVLTAHPGDEVLGVGGSLAVLAAGGARLRTVFTGNGGDDESLRRLGLVPDEAVHRLGLPDGALDDCEDELTDIIARMIGAFDLCLAPWTGDAHPDLESVGRAASVAGASAGVTVAHYPILMWHWAEPADVQVPWYLASRVELPEWARAAKQDAISLREGWARTPGGLEYDDGALLDARESAYFDRPFEVLFA
jgi:LmbE family N-acetylglucosaminyl deacetylase